MIPKSFELLGRTIKVSKTKKGRFIDSAETFGHWDSNKFEIFIQDGLTEQQEEQTFYHEFFHAAFDSLGYTDLSANEQLVDQMASLMQQLMKSKK